MLQRLSLAASALCRTAGRPLVIVSTMRKAAHRPCAAQLLTLQQQQQQPYQQQRRGFAQIDFAERDQGAVDYSTPEIVCQRRTVDGTRQCNMLREQRLIPGIVYGVDSSGNDRRLLVQIPNSEMQRELNKFGRAIQNILYNVRVEDEVFQVLPRCLQDHPTSEVPLSVNFLIHSPTRKVKVKIPLEFFNVEKCTGLKQGGRLEITQRDLDCYVTGNDIPRIIRVNLAGYSIGERVRMEEVDIPKHVLPTRPQEMIFKISGRRGVKVPVDSVEEE